MNDPFEHEDPAAEEIAADDPAAEDPAAEDPAAEDSTAQDPEFRDDQESTAEGEPTEIHPELEWVSSIPERDEFTGSPRGMRRGDAEGLDLVDAMSGQSSLLGWGHTAITEALQQVASNYLGDDANTDQQDQETAAGLLDLFRALLAPANHFSVDSLTVTSSADLAIEQAILRARSRNPDHAFRTISLVGSDHGRSGVCRCVSGIPELQEGWGPLMAGFSHVLPGDIKALEQRIDEQTACVLLAPVDFDSACRLLAADYLHAVSELCQRHDALLIIDESKLCFGSAGQPISIQTIADVPIDGLVLSGGLFAGIAGGVLLASSRLAESDAFQVKPNRLQSLVLARTLAAATEQSLPVSAGDMLHELAVQIAESVQGFQFVRDLNVLGATVGMETDLPAAEILQSARRHGLRMEPAGDHGVWMQLPLILSDQDRDELLNRLQQSLETVERRAYTSAPH